MGAIALSYPPLLLLMTHHEKNAAESFTVALTLTLEGYKSAIAPTMYVVLFILGKCLLDSYQLLLIFTKFGSRVSW